MIKQPEKLAKIATLSALTFLVCIGLVLVVFPIKPFWGDERCIIYNLKMKDTTALWGQLDLMQQFPRTYLHFIKLFTSTFGYSYTSLRLPSFLIATATLLLGYRLMLKLYPGNGATKFLFLLLLASAHTFVQYFVQIKQYTMDIFMSVLVLWQLLQLLQLKSKEQPSMLNYLLLCLSFIVVPFFSYSYPILVGPVFMIAVLQTALYKPQAGDTRKSTFVIKLWIPLLLCVASLVVFYVVDVGQLLQDKGMKLYWDTMMMKHGFDPLLFLRSFYTVFSNLGNGLLFETILGISGTVAFITSISDYVRNFRANTNDNGAQLRLYGIMLIGAILVLFVAGKLPIGEPRLNAYSVPAIAILIIYLLNQLYKKPQLAKLMGTIIVVLFLGTIGNIINNPIKNIVNKEPSKERAIFKNVTAGIELAESKKLPIFVTSTIAYPDDKVLVFPNSSIKALILCYPPGFDTTLHFNNPEDVPAYWVLKTNPAYKMSSNLPVYSIDSISKAEQYIDKVPGKLTAVVAISDATYQICYKRGN